MGPQKIILFGGTFDPPHNGHMTLLAGAIEAVRPDLVLVEPAGTPPHKRAGGTSAAHRLVKKLKPTRKHKELWAVH